MCVCLSVSVCLSLSLCLSVSVFLSPVSLYLSILSHFFFPSIFLSNPTEATAEFTRKMEESLKSRSTQINFFIHNLAQRGKFGAGGLGGESAVMLSFAPNTYSVKTDGRIKHLEILDCRKRYNPEKHYVSVILLGESSSFLSLFFYQKKTNLFTALEMKLFSLRNKALSDIRICMSFLVLNEQIHFRLFLSRFTCCLFIGSRYRPALTGRCITTNPNLPSFSVVIRNSSNSTIVSFKHSLSPLYLSYPANLSSGDRRSCLI